RPTSTTAHARDTARTKSPRSRSRWRAGCPSAWCGRRRSTGSGDVPATDEALAHRPASGDAGSWLAAARGDVEAAREIVDGRWSEAEENRGAGVEDGRPAAYVLYDAVRLGAPERVAGRLARLPGDGPAVLARHAEALVDGDGPALDKVAGELEQRGFLLFAAEAHAQAVRAHRDPRAARMSRTRAVALARRCQGARTPALSGLVLGELTARQRQIVTLAAAGLSNRQIADRLTLSVRTVGNHLYSAYARLGASDRGALPWLVELPAAQSA
ncbi:response regulator transcription factor, partial [Streptomyces sp. Agncl-13]|uniref:helix-turn-helix transcriptional regulator n=1 Tax=Streptomyces sp. Agncl-13 TaxID=3400628 RepID=UPI003A8645C4